jgi:succinyl-diaminopimelate desuccinylase
MRSLEDITKELISFRTVKGHDEEFSKGFEFIEQFFRKTDLEIQEHNINGFKTVVVSSNEDPDILLHGHLDVVSADEDELFEASEDEEKIYGRGAADMKSGLACMMKTVKELSEEDRLGSVGLMVVSDEEIGGFNGAEPLSTEYDPNFALSAEPNSGEYEMQIVTKQKGVVRLELEVEGQRAHGSQPWNGENAVEKLYDRYTQFKSNFKNKKDEWTTTINLGNFNSDGAVNVVPGSAKAGVDIRYTEEYTPEEIRKDLESIDGLDWNFSSIDPMLKTKNSNKYVQKLYGDSSDMCSTQLDRKTAASDMRHFSKENIPCVVMGPKGGGIHNENEYILKQSMYDFKQILTKFLTDAG